MANFTPYKTRILVDTFGPLVIWIILIACDFLFPILNFNRGLLFGLLSGSLIILFWPRKYLMHFEIHNESIIISTIDSFLRKKSLTVPFDQINFLQYKIRGKILGIECLILKGKSLYKKFEVIGKKNVKIQRAQFEKISNQLDKENVHFIT